MPSRGEDIVSSTVRDNARLVDAEIPTPALGNSNGVERGHSLATKYRHTEPLESCQIVRHLDSIHDGRLIDMTVCDGIVIVSGLVIASLNPPLQPSGW